MYHPFDMNSARWLMDSPSSMTIEEERKCAESSMAVFHSRIANEIRMNCKLSNDSVESLKKQQVRKHDERNDNDKQSAIQNNDMVQSVVDIKPDETESTNKQIEFGISLLGLDRYSHIRFIHSHCQKLDTKYRKISPAHFNSQPWLHYWLFQAQDLLQGYDRIKPLVHQAALASLLSCKSQTGGFGGGPNQLAHAAPTYAAIATLYIMKDIDALLSIDRDELLSFLMSLKNPKTQAFKMHHQGEEDLRATYCVIAVASMMNILRPELCYGVGEYIFRCQTYEGGFSGEPGGEAHGGYTYCGMAALVMINETWRIDVDLLLEWALQRQLPFQGGFQGRIGKLVDSCYTFWLGALFTLIKEALGQIGIEHPFLSFKQLQKNISYGMQTYVLGCTQATNGGIRDKPGKPPDLYHTCYGLSGLSIAQNSILSDVFVLGKQCNKLDPIYCCYNVKLDSVKYVREKLQFN